MTFKELQKIYSENFSLGYIDGNGARSPIENRFVLISLICYITYKTKLKNPDATHYQIIMKLSTGLGLPDDFIKGLSIVCEDFSYACHTFPTFGLKGKDIIKEVISILKTYIPF
jgi:hypothetical protein